MIGNTATKNIDQLEVTVALAKIYTQDGCDLTLMFGDKFFLNSLKNLEGPLFEKAFLNVYQELDVPVFPILGKNDTNVDLQV